MKRYFSKTIIALLISSFALAGSDVEADRAWNKEHRMAVSVDALSWVGGNFRFQLEASMNDRLAFNMPIGFGFDKVIFNNSYYNGGHFAPKFGVKYYVTGKATHQGFYVNPLLGMFVGKQNGKNSTEGALSYGFRVGYAWNIWRGVWVDGFFGYENYAVSFNSKGNDNNEGAVPAASGDGLTKNPLGGANVGLMVGYNW